jgi:hypothetical protein
VVFCTGTSTADPAVDADAPPAIAKDTPAIPNVGAALFRLLRFKLFLARAIGGSNTESWWLSNRRTVRALFLRHLRPLQSNTKA